MLAFSADPTVTLVLAALAGLVLSTFALSICLGFLKRIQAISPPVPKEDIEED